MKNLWPILEPTGQQVKLDDLRGQKVAVDLNCWILVSSQITNRHGRKVPGVKLHVQNLFWRCYHLLRHQIIPVFVLDGVKPSLKRKSHRETNRSDNQTVNECKKLLNCLGLPWIVSSGEAEALCAKLNESGVVDGCITDDGDAFLYGADTVYRHFACSKQNAGKTRVFCKKLLKEHLGLDRERLIVLALLLGCDYTHGTRNVGPETALKLLGELRSDNVLERLRSWRENKMFAELKETQKLHKPKHCSNCQHEGSIVSHQVNGCLTCGTEVACNKRNNNECNCKYHVQHRNLTTHAVEVRVREWALEDVNFPSDMVVDEYLNPKCEPNERIGEVEWKQPNWGELQNYLEENVKMDVVKQKINELVVSWNLLYSARDNASPKCIGVVKSRIQNKVSLLQVLWMTKGDTFTTLENREIMLKHFPEAVELFESTKKKQKKIKGDSNVKLISFRSNVSSESSKQCEVSKRKRKRIQLKRKSLNGAGWCKKQKKAKTSVL